MPTLQNVTTKESKFVWASPDKQREINEVVLEYEGNTFRAKTYSSDIATVGWNGAIESYEKDSRNGSETFVKQPARENPGYGGGASRSGQSGGYTPRDDSHIKAQWAIGQAMTALFAEGKGDLELVEALAIELFDMVDRVKTAEVTSQGPADGPVAERPMDEVHEVTGQEDLLKDIDEVFSPKPDEPKPVGELPWKKN